jgi:hypothetical protein
MQFCRRRFSRRKGWHYAFMPLTTGFVNQWTLALERVLVFVPHLAARVALTTPGAVARSLPTIKIAILTHMLQLSGFGINRAIGKT